MLKASIRLEIRFFIRVFLLQVYAYLSRDFLLK